MENLNYKYEILTNFKNSVECIKKAFEEIERHPENKKIILRTIKSTLKYQSFTNFKVIALKRSRIEETCETFKEEYQLKDKLCAGDSDSNRYFFTYEGNCSYMCQTVKILQALESSERIDRRYQKILGINKDDELILFVIDRYVPFTKEETKMLKELFED